MVKEGRRIADFIMGGATGFCFTYGESIGYPIGALMVVSFLIYTFRERMLNKIDKDLKADITEEEQNGTK